MFEGVELIDKTQTALTPTPLPKRAMGFRPNDSV